jgi:hypothetical protein
MPFISKTPKTALLRGRFHIGAEVFSSPMSAVGPKWRLHCEMSDAGIATLFQDGQQH